MKQSRSNRPQARFEAERCLVHLGKEIYKKTNLTNTYIPVDKNRIIKANNELKLKRNTPINNNKNTLDNCMNIKF